MKRKIVNIDENKCNGCGLCVPSCAEGAIKIIDGKAKLMAENLCDGLGACLGECPQDAINIIEREADEFDEAAVERHLNSLKSGAKAHSMHGHHAGCPGSRAMEIDRSRSNSTSVLFSDDIEINIKSQLTQWPVQLNLVPIQAPYFDDADLLVTADCVPIAYPNYHLELLKGKKVVIGCPKLDDVQYYIEKLTDIIMVNNIKSVTVAFMEVPCCGGILRAVEEAMARSGKNIPVYRVKVNINGEAVKLG